MARLSRNEKIIGVVCSLIVAGPLLSCLIPRHRYGPDSKMQCSSQIRQLSQAMGQYEQRHGSFPPAYVVKNGHKHSWRVLLLPYLERSDLYKQYRFDEAWDGPNNRKLAGMITMQIWRCPRDPPRRPDDYSTNYLVVAGEGAIFNGETNVSSEVVERYDGLNNTLLIVEAVNTGIHWMEPRDLSIEDVDKAFDINAGKSLSSHHTGGANVVYVNTRTFFLDSHIDRKVLRALMTYNGGETIRDEDFP